MSTDFDLNTITSLRTIRSHATTANITEELSVAFVLWLNVVNAKGTFVPTVNVAIKVTCDECENDDVSAFGRCRCNPVFGLESNNSRFSNDPDMLCELSLNEEDTDFSLALSVDENNQRSFVDHLSEHGIDPYEAIVLDSVVVNSLYEMVYSGLRDWLVSEQNDV